LQLDAVNDELAAVLERLSRLAINPGQLGRSLTLIDCMKH